MSLEQLHALSPLDGRYGHKTQTLKNTFSEYGLIRFRLQVEIDWLLWLHQQDIITPATLTKEDEIFLQNLYLHFDDDIASATKKIEETTNHDVKAVEYFLAEKLAKRRLKSYIPFLHFACTSEDINNVAYALMLQHARKHIFLPTLHTLQSTIRECIEKSADIAMLSRTHGQPASPTTLGKEIANTLHRLQRQIKQYEAQPLLAKFNGAVGNYNAHMSAFPNVNWPQCCQRFIESLGLHYNPFTTQIEPHDFIAELMHIIMRANTVLIDFARDVWGYISLNYFSLEKIAHEVGSSTMPHKINPIDFENAEGNLGIANAIADHLANKLPISRWQRDLSDSTVIRNIGTVFGYSLIAYQALIKGINKLKPNRDLIQNDLNSHWEVLAEPIQTVLRAHGIADAYEQLKALTRGEKITPAVITQFIDTLTLPENSKQALKQLTPTHYIGLAEVLAKEI